MMTYSNERDLLKAQFLETYDVVSKFLVIEAPSPAGPSPCTSLQLPAAPWLWLELQTACCGRWARRQLQ